MMAIGVQTKNVVEDKAPEEGFFLLEKAGFSCVDFSLNSYLDNISLYQAKRNSFFEMTAGELEHFFTPHKEAAEKAGIRIHQMHMPYPLYIPQGKKELNDFLREEAAPKSMQICAFLGCRYIVVHGFKLSYFLGSEEAEWEQTQSFLESLAPMAKEMGITMCIENLYHNRGNHLVEGPCCDAIKAAERIDRMNDKFAAQVLGFCFDTGHANLVGIDFERFITTLDYRLKVLHIHDNDGIGDLHQIPFTFTRNRENKSSTDWEGFIRGLRAVSFEGALSFETAPVLTAFPKELKLDALRFIAQIGKYFSDRLVQ